MERKNTISDIIIKWSKNPNIAGNVYFLDKIPDKKLKNAMHAYAKIGTKEKVMVLKDETLFGSAKCGFVLTDRALYHGYLNGKKAAHWEEIDSIYFYNGRIMLRNDLILKFDLLNKSDFNQYLMLHEVFRNMKGRTIFLDPIKFKQLNIPKNCIGCCSRDFSNSIEVRIIGPHDPNWIKRHSLKLGILGFVIGAVLGGTVQENKLLQSLPICNRCWGNLYEKEQKLSMGWLSVFQEHDPIFFCDNRYTALNIIEGEHIEFWFSNTEFAEGLYNLNALENRHPPAPKQETNTQPKPTAQASQEEREDAIIREITTSGVGSRFAIPTILPKNVKAAILFPGKNGIETRGSDIPAWRVNVRSITDKPGQISKDIGVGHNVWGDDPMNFEVIWQNTGLPQSKVTRATLLGKADASGWRGECVVLVGIEEPSIGELWYMKVHYPKDRFILCLANGVIPILPETDNGVMRFEGQVRYCGYTFAGDETDPLAFILLKEKGFVYLHGRGEVIAPDSKKTRLPQ